MITKYFNGIFNDILHQQSVDAQCHKHAGDKNGLKKVLTCNIIDSADER